MPITLDGTSGITTPGLTNTGTETVVNLTTTGNTIIGDATTDTLTVGVTGIVKDASGNVGIGTASPASGRRLTVSTTSTDSAIRIDAPTGYYSYLELTENGSLTSGNYWQISKIPTTNAMQFWNGAERMRIDASGNLGLGGTTNSYGSQTTFTLSGTNVSRIDFRSNNVFTGSILSYQSIPEGLRLQTEAGYPITFYPAGTARLWITSAGYVGVNTSSPETNGAFCIRRGVTTSAMTNCSFSTSDAANSTFDVGHPSANLVALSPQGSSLALWAGSAERARITSGGSFLIGKTSGSTYLNVSTAFEYLATTFTSGAGNYGYLALPQTPSVTLMLVNLTNQNNGNLNIAFLLLCNTRSTGHGGGNGVTVVSVIQNTTGTGGEISTYAFAISGSGTSLSLRATCTLVSGSAVIDFTARIIQI